MGDKREKNTSSARKKRSLFTLFGVLYCIFSLGVCTAFAVILFIDSDNELKEKSMRFLYFTFIASIFFFPFTNNQNQSGEPNYHPPIYALLCIFSNTQDNNGKQVLIMILALILLAMGAEIPKIVFGS